MTNVLMLGGHGRTTRVASDLFLENTDAELTLYLRHTQRLSGLADHDRERVVEGEVLDAQTLEGAMQGQDVVYANLRAGSQPPRAWKFGAA